MALLKLLLPACLVSKLVHRPGPLLLICDLILIVWWYSVLSIVENIGICAKKNTVLYQRSRKQICFLTLDVILFV